MTDSTNTENSKKRTELMFNACRATYCCGILEIGDFNLKSKPAWMKNAPKPEELSPERGLTIFQAGVAAAVRNEYGPETDWEEVDYDEYNGSCLLKASVAIFEDPYTADFHRNPQLVAEEYLKADGWDLTSEFKNVNSTNKVRVYQKVVDAGEIIRAGR
jgi:hypothetical protein